MALSFLPSFLADQFFRTPSPCTRSFAGQTIIITGANTGLGKSAAGQIAALGASRVILAVRSTSKGEQAKRDLESASSNSCIFEVWQLDLGSYASVTAFAKRCQTLERLDAVIENAGVYTGQYVRAEGYESTITVNVISTFLLMHLLLPQLEEQGRRHGTTPRLAVVSSELFMIAPLKAKNAPRILEAMSDEKTADMKNRYPDSKLLEVLYLEAYFGAQKAAGTFGQSNVIINYVQPGFCISELTREQNGMTANMMRKYLARSTEEGARTEVYAASAGRESHGMYQNNGKTKGIQGTWPASKKGQAVAAKILAELNEQLERIVPGVTKHV